MLIAYHPNKCTQPIHLWLNESYGYFVLTCVNPMCVHTGWITFHHTFCIVNKSSDNISNGRHLVTLRCRHSFPYSKATECWNEWKNNSSFPIVYGSNHSIQGQWITNSMCIRHSNNLHTLFLSQYITIFGISGKWKQQRFIATEFELVFLL